MNPTTFRTALQALLQGAAESGLDPFFLHNELTLAGMQLVDSCRADLLSKDDPFWDEDIKIAPDA
jgi:hypothetical protein